MEAYNPPHPIPRGQRTYINEHHQLSTWPGWLALLTRNKTATDDNIRRALLWCKDDWDREELQLELDRRIAKRKFNRVKKAEVDLEKQPPILRLLVNRMPPRPYSADKFEEGGTKIRRKSEALKHREIQISIPHSQQAMIFDIDHTDPLDSRLPPPNMLITNPESGHRHGIIVLERPVIMGRSALPAPQRYFVGLKQAIGQCWMADTRYSGLLTHNPLHDHWLTEILHPEPYRLDDFKDALKLSPKAANNPRRGDQWAEDYASEGKNNRTWEACRWEGYAMGTSANFETMLRIVEDYNLRNNMPPLPYPECKSIAKSIVKYCRKGVVKGLTLSDDDWEAYVKRTHKPEIQSIRGRLSGAARRAQNEDKRVLAQGMIDQGYTQSVIAEQLGVSKGCISKWLRQ